MWVMWWVMGFMCGADGWLNKDMGEKRERDWIILF